MGAVRTFLLCYDDCFDMDGISPMYFECDLPLFLNLPLPSLHFSFIDCQTPHQHRLMQADRSFIHVSRSNDSSFLRRVVSYFLSRHVFMSGASLKLTLVSG